MLMTYSSARKGCFYSLVGKSRNPWEVKTWKCPKLCILNELQPINDCDDDDDVNKKSLDDNDFVNYDDDRYEESAYEDDGDDDDDEEQDEDDD